MGFFSKKDKKSTADSSDNPYAQEPPAGHIPQPPPMATYERPRAGLPSGPRPGGGGLPSGPSPRMNTGYGGFPAPRQSDQSSGGGYGTPNASLNAGGYDNDRQGYSGGYGGNRYNNSGGVGQGQSRSTGPGQRGPGGYGGMGGLDRSGDQDGSDAARDELFGPKPQSTPSEQNRYRQPAPAAPLTGPGYNRVARNDSDTNRGALFAGAQDMQKAGTDGMYGGGQSGVERGSYGGYGEERELTEEEKEERKIQEVAEKMIDVRNKDINSLDRTEMVLQQALETGEATVQRLHHQGDMLNNAQRSVNQASLKAEEAHGNSKDLYRIQKSMLSGIGGGFNKKKRHMKEDEQNEQRRREAEEQRAAVHAAGYRSNQLVANATNRKKYDLENDEEEEYEAKKDRIRKQQGAYLADGSSDSRHLDQEVEIDDRLKRIERLMPGAKHLAVGMGDIVTDHNTNISKLSESADRVGDGIQRNRHVLNRIR